MRGPPSRGVSACFIAVLVAVLVIPHSPVLYLNNRDLSDNLAHALPAVDLLGPAGDQGILSKAASPLSPASIPVGSTPTKVLYDSGNGKVYVSNSGSDSVTVLDGQTLAAVYTVPVGSKPTDLAVDARSGNIYVANSGSQNLSIINGTTNRVVGSVDIGSNPVAVAYNPVNGYLFVPNMAQNLTVIDASNNSVVRQIAGFSVPTGWSGSFPVTAAYDGQDGFVYVSVYSPRLGDDAVLVVNGTTLAGPYNPPPGYNSAPHALVFDPDNGKMLADEPYWGVIAYNSSGINTGGTLVGNGTPNLCALGGAYDSSAHLVLFTSSCEVPNATQGQHSVNALVALNSTSLTAVGNLTLGSTPAGVAVDSGNGDVLVANPSTGTVSVYPVTSPAALYAVSVTSNRSTMNTGATSTFLAAPSCIFGACSSGTMFSWSLSNQLLTITSSFGNEVTVTAGLESGNASLVATGTLAGATARSPPLNITIIPGLSNVSISASASRIPTGGTSLLSAAVLCNGGQCPPGLTLAWTLSNSLGTLNDTSGPRVVFFAGDSSGNEIVSVSATLNGLTVNGSLTIQVGTEPITPLNWEITGIILGGAAIVVVFGVWIGFQIRRRRAARRDDSSESNPDPPR